jgi:DNA processing protein
MRLLEPNEIPIELLELPQPPKQLYIVGNLPDAGNVYLTVVGSREHTRYGQDVCTKLIEGLAGYPITIVSGLALGIDTLAHQAALRVGLTTISFPGSGLEPNAIHPRENVDLAKRIVDSGGCLLSEFKPMQKGTHWTFPQRNRLMAGLAKATLIIEAEYESGTLITARLATEYNRDVLTVPGSILSSKSDGPNMLLRLGATPIRSSRDILEALGFDVSNTEEASQKRMDRLRDCTPEEKEILHILMREPLPRDELARQIGKPMHEVNTMLSVMEIKGLIKEEYGEIRRI